VTSGTVSGADRRHQEKGAMHEAVQAGDLKT